MLLPPLLPSLPNTTLPSHPLITLQNLTSPLSAGPYPPPTCYPPTSSNPSIRHLADCTTALSRITESAPFNPETWDEPSYAWIYNSCAVWLVPRRQFASEAVIIEDTFYRSEVRARASSVVEVCVEGGGGRGGWGVVGGKRAWEVLVGGVGDGDGAGAEKEGKGDRGRVLLGWYHGSKKKVPKADRGR
ncbi:hypothetical protein ACLMJK_001464 [Lecanora helva]